MKNLYNIIFILIVGMYAEAQTIKGKILDNKTKETLPFVEVTISPTNKVTNSDENGNFIFSDVNKGSYTLHFLLDGYKYKRQQIEVTKNSNIVTVFLDASEETLDEVMIFATPTQPTKRAADALYTGVEISQKGLEIIGSKGMSSVNNILNISPSVAVFSKDPYGLSGTQMRIRGAKSYFSGLTTEGIPNYGVMPIGGREDIYDAENLQSVSLHKGAVPADVFSASGNRGGSVDVRYKRPTHNFGANINQSYGTNNFTRTFLRLDTGEFDTGTSAFFSYSYTEADKWKGKGKLAERDHITTAISQKIGEKFNLELMYNYNNISKHHFRNYSVSKIKDFEKNYNFDFNEKLTGNPAKDQFYYDHNKGDYKNQLGIVMLHYKPNAENKGAIKFYITKEDAKFRSHQRTRKDKKGNKIYVLRDATRDLKQMGTTINWSGKINNVNYAVGYWFEAFVNYNLGRFYKNAKDMSLLNFGQYKKQKTGSTFIHNPFIKLSYSYQNFKIQAGLRYMANISSGEDVFKLKTKKPLTFHSTKEKDMSIDRVTHDAFLPSLGIGYKFSDKLEAYLNYGRNYMRPYAFGPTFNTYAKYRKIFLENNYTYQDIIGNYDMETSDNFDLGLIFNHKKVKVNANVYYSKQKDVLVNVVSPLPNLNASYLQNAGKLTTYGAELETYFNINRNFTLFFHPSYTNISYDNNIERFNRKGKRITIKLKGNQSPATPKYMIKSGILYSYKGFKFNSMVNYTGERYGDALNIFKIPSFTVADASVSYKHDFGKSIKSISLGMEVKNIFNKKYIGAIRAWDDAQEGRASYNVGFPRAFIGSLKINL